MPVGPIQCRVSAKRGQFQKTVNRHKQALWRPCTVHHVSSNAKPLHVREIFSVADRCPSTLKQSEDRRARHFLRGCPRASTKFCAFFFHRKYSRVTLLACGSESVLLSPAAAESNKTENNLSRQERNALALQTHNKDVFCFCLAATLAASHVFSCARKPMNWTAPSRRTSVLVE